MVKRGLAVTSKYRASSAVRLRNREKSRGSDISKISSNRKLKWVKRSAPTTPRPTSHNQGDKAVTIRPPSKNPIGARLKRLRKKPLKASARNSGVPVARYNP